jgi:enoyl-CoA hydratase/carnithine racemase
MANANQRQQIFLERRTPAYWRVALNNPPFNIFGPDSIPQLNEVITALESDKEVKVVVFESAVPGFFLTHYDFTRDLEESTSMAPGPTGMHPLPDMLVRLSRVPVVSIVSIRGRATGVGSELALASDMRFESRKGCPLAMGSRRCARSRRRSNGTAAPLDGTGSCP